MSEHTDRDERGQFDSEIDDDVVVRYFAEGRPFHTAGEVADRFGIDRSTAYRRLRRLAEDGRLEKVTLGSRTVVWWDATDADPTAEEADADDPLFAAPSFAVDDPVDEDGIDDVLYGETDG